MGVKNFYSMSPLDLATISGRSPEIVEGTGRPSHLIDPRKKDKAWVLAMTKSIYNDFNKYCPNLFYNNRARHNETVNFLQGVIEPSRYQKMVDQNASHNTNLTQVNHDKRILNLLSKYFRLINGRLNDVEFDITIKPNNNLAREQDDEYRTMLKTFMQLSKILEENNVGQISDFLGEQGFEIPDNNEELEIQMQMSKPSQLAMFLKRALREINYLDKVDQKFSEEDYYLPAFGCAGIETTVNANGVPTRTPIDPRNLLAGFSATEDGRDMSEVGKFRMATINDIRMEDGGKDLKIEDLKDIEKYCMGRYGNEVSYSGINTFGRTDELYGRYRTMILDIFFYSYDEQVTVAKPNGEGNPIMVTKGFEYYRGREAEYEKKYPNKRIYRTKTQNVYKASWIVGTDYIYNCGLVKNIHRPSTDIFSCTLPISIIAPLIKNGRTVSVIEEMIVIAERANLIWQKMEESLAHARPPGFEIDIDSLMAAIGGLADQGYTFDKALEMIMEHNIVIKSTKSMGGIANGNRPFEERPGGLGPEFAQYFQELQGCIQLFQEMSGMSGVAAASPEKYTGKKVAELATTSAEYSIRHLFRAKKTLYENVMQTSVRLLLDSIVHGDSEVLRKYIGSNAFDFIKQNANAYECVLMIEFRPTKEDWQRLYDAASIAIKVPLEQGGISYVDYVRVVDSETIEEAEQLLRLLYNRNIRKAQQQAIKLQQTNGEEQRKSAEQAAMLEQQRYAMEVEHERTKIAMQTAAELDKLEVAFRYKLEEKKLEGLIKGDHINTQGAIDKGITEIQAKYNMDRAKQKEAKSPKK
jgi:hypothetical protein